MKSSVRLLLVTSAILSVSSITIGADTYPRQPGFTIANYAFSITLSDESNEIVMNEVVDLQFTAAGVASITLDLCKADPARARGAVPDPCLGARNGSASPGGGGLSGSANTASGPTGMTLTAVSGAADGTGSGQPLHFTHQNDRVRIDLPQPSQPRMRFSVSLSYHGTPSTGLQIGNNQYGDRGFFSNDWPNLAHNWLATIDHPSMKAPISMTVTAPRHYQGISNGRLIEETDLPDGLRRTMWRESVPIPTWQFSLGVAPFAVRQFGDYAGIPLSAWVYPQERDNGFKGFGDVTASILEFYSTHIGAYSYEKLAHVQATTVSGGMELASSIFYGYRGVPGRQLIAHETAHQWFGDSATEKDWDDVWLSEGFATYFALLYAEHMDGRDAFIAGVKGSAANAIRYALANPASTIVHDNLSDISKVIANNAQVYQGGAQVLHMLRGLLGDERFWAGIKLYYSRFRNSNATSDDFRHAMEDACVNAGNCPDDLRDLSWYFREWLNRGGVLQLKGGWHYDAAAKQLTITLDQAQTTGLYRMPIEVAIVPAAAPAAATGRGGGASAASAPTKIVIDQARTTMTIPLAAEPADVQLDPRSWLTLMQASFARQ